MMRFGLVSIIAVLMGCSTSSDSEPADTTVPADSAPLDLVTDVKPLEATVEEFLTDVPLEILPLVVPPGPESRGWQQKRGVVHLHSALSHDGCAPDGYEDFGGPDPVCLGQLRAAPCANDMDFLMMTDHPGHSSEHPFEEMVQFNEAEGDEIVKDGQEMPFANRMTCPAGSAVDTVLIFAGTEGSKHMPIAMSGPIPPKVFQQNYMDESPLEEAQAAAAMVREQGGYVFIPHPEEKSISVDRIVAMPLDGIEIYNIHANLMTVLESMDTIFGMDRFLLGAENPPDSDLVMLMFLAAVDKDVEKFDAAAAQIRLSHIAATDIHQNVEIPALCPGGIEGSLCEAFADEYPNFAAFAMNGGPIPMADGDRVDSYGRSFRWLSNRALVLDGDPQSIRDAIGKGRSYSTFDLFGYPAGFDFFISDGESTWEMGEETTLSEGLQVYFNTPVLTAAPWRQEAGWDYQQATVSCQLIRADANGSTIVTQTELQGEQTAISVTDPGAYRVFCTVVPIHVKPALPGVQHLGNTTYPYLYSNAIFVR